MIKNIILDVGGVILDDSKENIDKILKKDSKEIYKKAFGGNFKKCLLGEMTVDEHIKLLKEDKDYEDINYILNKKNLKITYPLFKENYEYIKTLKNKGYKLFILSNITEDSYLYMKEEKLLDIMDGGIYSYQEHLVKPDEKIYELIIKKYNLKKEETIFFDDKEKNVEAAKKCNIKSIKFETIEDIKKFDKINSI